MEKPQKLITTARAKELQQEWWNTRSIVTTNGNSHKDTCEFHFTLDEFQEYLDYVKSRSEDLGIQNPGINIWLGAYEAKNEKPNLTTLFFSATRDKSNIDEDDSRNYEENEEIEPMNIVSGQWPPTPY